MMNVTKTKGITLFKQVLVLSFSLLLIMIIGLSLSLKADATKQDLKTFINGKITDASKQVNAQNELGLELLTAFTGHQDETSDKAAVPSFPTQEDVLRVLSANIDGKLNDNNLEVKIETHKENKTENKINGKLQLLPSPKITIQVKTGSQDFNTSNSPITIKNIVNKLDQIKDKKDKNELIQIQGKLDNAVTEETLKQKIIEAINENNKGLNLNASFVDIAINKNDVKGDGTGDDSDCKIRDVEFTINPKSNVNKFSGSKTLTLKYKEKKSEQPQPKEDNNKKEDNTEKKQEDKKEDNKKPEDKKEEDTSWGWKAWTFVIVIILGVAGTVFYLIKNQQQ